MNFFSTFDSFWTKNPALFIGLCLVLGGSFAFYPHFLLCATLGLLSFTRRKAGIILVGITCFCIACILAQWRHPLLTIPQEKIEGKALFHIIQVKPYSSFFNRSILYKGILKQFHDKEGNSYTNLPCQIYLPLQGKKNPANQDYVITGTLCQKDRYSYVLKPDKKVDWEPKRAFLPNLAQWRYEAKQTLLRHLKTHIQDPQSCTLLHALITGDVDERILSMELGKIGLQHMLAVSGFHFALLAMFVTTLLRFLFSPRISLSVLIGVISLYYLFVGHSPSIQRAYIAIMLVAIGQLLNGRISGLNALGIGLMIEILLKPLNILDLGFQLSFLCTLAILLIYPVIKKFMEQLLLKRSDTEALQLSLFNQHAYLVCRALRAVLSLNLAVHLISVPVLLYLFHKFPLISLVYNLIFPVCLSLSMILLFIALLLAPILPLFSHWIHAVNDMWTSTILTFSANPPATLDFCLRTNRMTLPWIILFLSLSFFMGVLLFEKEKTLS